ncbi:MAG: hypothetical protein P0116_15965 [Candidatus Nitrosocosmicus sp.]|nr:hypothetical protein [Candidatus Nitrosocosmicus sp.]
MIHQEIRFRILLTLYNKHYSNMLGHIHPTESVIEESELNDIDKNVIYGDIVYLEDSELIIGQGPIGSNHSLAIKITHKGIDYVDKAINEFIETKLSEFEKLIKEQDPKIKIGKAWEIIKANQGLISTFVNFLSKFAN